MRPRAELVLVGVTILWGSDVHRHQGRGSRLAPLPFLTFRFGAGGAGDAALVPAAPDVFARRRRRRRWCWACSTDRAFLQVFGQVYTTASKSAFITSLNTPLTPLVAYLLYRTRPSRPQLAAVLLASGGLLLLTWPRGGAHWNAGDLFTMGCAILYAFTDRGDRRGAARATATWCSLTDGPDRRPRR